MRVVGETYGRPPLDQAAVLFCAMYRRARENLALLLFFPSLGYLIFRGWERFVECGCVGRAWFQVLGPSVAMTLALLIWPQLTRDNESE